MKNYQKNNEVYRFIELPRNIYTAISRETFTDLRQDFVIFAQPDQGCAG